WRLKGTDGIILASAAMAPDCPTEGECANVDMDLVNGQGYLSDTAVKAVGNFVTLEQMVRNFWQSTGCELSEAFKMATYNPALQLGMIDSKGSLAPGKDADIIAITPDFDVVMTMISGEIISGLIAV
ncbi:MAG TPA: amidohydrolase family protein, partial [Bacillota bacterium]|nr:amidohydrolase family protein [Bacillota bacterium]